MIDASDEDDGQYQLGHAPKQGALDVGLTLATVESCHHDKYGHEQVERDIVLHVVLVDAVHGQGRIVNVGKIGLVIESLIVYIRNESDGHQGSKGVDAATEWPVVVESPGKHSHEQCCQQGIEAQEGIACGHGEHDENGAQEKTLRQRPVGPCQRNGCGGANGGNEEVAAQLQVVKPIAQVDVGDEQQRDGDEHGECPFRWDVERSLQHPHEQQPPEAEQGNTHPLMIEKLGEVGAHVGEQSSRDHHLLLEEQGCVEEQVELLHAEEKVALEGE